ncbi:MAG: hypothetical protein J7M19_01040 [Planctomycetes bacterium]|nr:hypothetical protein [Planctomycetota bacterium]
MNRIAFFLSTAFWLVMMGLLFKIDVLPGYVAQDNPGYEAVVRVSHTPIVREMAVFKDTVQVGMSQTVTTPEVDGTYTIVNLTSLKIQVGAIQARVQAILEVILDKDKQLDNLFMAVNFAGKRAEVTGVRAGDRLKIRLKVAGETFEEVIPYDNAVISSYFNPFPLGARLKVGQRWRTKFLDPLSQRARAVEVKVVGKETIELAIRDGEPPRQFKVYKVVMDWGGSQLAAWATQEGMVLKEETPWGYTLVYRETPEDDQSSIRIEVLRREMRGETPRSGD